MKMIRTLSALFFGLILLAPAAYAQDWSGLNDRWRNIGGVFPTNAPVTAIARKPGILDLFITGNDGRVYTSWFVEGQSDWSGLNDLWRNIGGVFPPGAPVTAVARKSGILDLFITGNDGRVYTSWWVEGQSDWSGLNDRWRNIGGVFPRGAPVTAVARKPGILDLFITGNDGRVYTSWFVEGQSDWSGLNDRWRNIGGVFPPGAPVAAVARKPGILDLFITGNDGRVYTSWFVEGQSDWSGLNDRWRNIGGVFPNAAALGAVARRPDQLDVFVTGNDGRVYTSWWPSGPNNTVYNLAIRRYTTSTLANADADSILAQANTVLQVSDGSDDTACPIQLQRSGAVTVFNTGNGLIASQADFNAVATPNVSVVNAISWCNGAAGPGLSIIGCGQTPGNSFVVVRLGSNEGSLWAHEFGHNKGNSHRSGANNLMNPSLDGTTRRVNQTECNAYLSSTGVAPAPVTTGAVIATGDLDSFVLRHYFEGIPYDEARAFGVTALPRLRQLLDDPSHRDFQANIVSMIGIVGGEGAADTLIGYVNANQERTLDPATYRGAVTAVMALGLVANVGDANALSFLAAKALALAAAAPASGTLRLEAVTVGQQAVLGLGLSGRPEAAQVLTQLRNAQIRAIAEPNSLLDLSQTTLSNVRSRGLSDVLRQRSLQQ